jgi:hypothetical protein
MSTYLKFKFVSNLQKSIKIKGFGAHFGAQVNDKS